MIKTLAGVVRPPIPPKNKKVATRQPPSCKNCKYFKPNYLKLSKSYCKYPISQTINIVSGKTKYDLAENMRKDYHNKCGTNAIFYEKETNKLKLVYQDIIYNIPNFTYVSYAFVYILLVILIYKALFEY